MRLVVLARAQVAAQAEQVVQLVRFARLAAQLPLDLGERLGIDQFAQLLLAEQLAEQVAVERKRLRAPLGGRRVVLVHIGGDVVEEERGGERRGGRGLDLDEVEPARLQAVQDPLQARAGRRRPAGTRGRSRARSGTSRTCAPPRAGSAPSAAAARAASAGRAASGMSSARAAFSRKRAPKSAVWPTSATTSSSISSGLIRRSARPGGASASGRWRAIRRPTRSTAPPARPSRAGGRRAPFPTARARGRRRGEDADAPVADLVAEALDDDGAVGGDDAGRGRLLAQEGEEVARRARVEVDTRRAGARAPSRPGGRRARASARPIFSPSSYGPPTPSPFQNGTAPGTPGAGETSTRSRVISSIRQVEAPSMKVWPCRAS